MPTLVLLPGMDGTGTLYGGLISALPTTIEAIAARYPTELPLTYAEMDDFVRAVCPLSEPFTLLAESFSVPLAIRYAATRPANLTNLILCAGFCASPLHGWKNWVARSLAPILFQMRIRDDIACTFLLGRNAPAELVADLRKALESVQPGVMVERLRNVLTCDVREELDRTVVPILYIQPAADRLVGPSCLMEILRVKPSVSVIVLDGPHLLLQREPGKAAEVISQFIDRQTNA